MSEREVNKNKELENSISGIISDYREVLNATQTELDLLKEELSKTKQEVKRTLEYNENSVNDCEEFNDGIVSNYKQQISFLKQERETLNSLWKVSQKTINRLEEEIKVYRNQLRLQPDSVSNIKEKYESSITCLKNSANIRKLELAKQIKVNREMIEERQKAQDEIKTLKTKLQNIEPNKETLESALRENELLKLKNEELEGMLMKANEMIEEKVLGENAALEKVQEALYLSEIAINEKNLALNREQICKEECKNFASIIGEVMDDAANKVEENYKELQHKYSCQIQKLLCENKLLRKELSDIRNNTKKVELHSCKMGDKCSDLMKVNSMLESNLKLSTKAIEELETKIKSYDKLIQREIQNEELLVQREREMERYVCENKNLKEKWKDAIEDFVKTFEDEICKLRESNTSLESENRELKAKLNI